MAADLYNRGAPGYTSLKDEPGPVPSFVWSGFYVGVNAGYAKSGKGNRTDLTLAASGVELGASGEMEPKGAFGGFTAGYNKQFGNWVLGVEADLQAAGLDDKVNGFHDAAPGFPFTSRASTQTEWFGTLRARFGYAKERALFYVTGGLAFADTDYSLTASNPTFGTVTITDSDVREGYVLGAGAEYMLNQNWTMKFEYQYLNFSDNLLFNQSTFNGEATGTFYKTDAELDFHTLRVGVNRKF